MPRSNVVRVERQQEATTARLEATTGRGSSPAGKTDNRVVRKKKKRAARGKPRPTYAIIRKEEEFFALETQWRELYRRSRISTFAQSFDSCAAAWREIARPQGLELYVVVGRRAERLCLILPLVVGRRGLIRVLYPLGSLAADYFDAIIEDSHAAAGWLGEAWDLIRRREDADLVDLWFVRADSVLSRAIGFEEMAHNSTMPASYLDLTEWNDMAAYRASRSANLKRNLKRYRRRLADKGSFESRIARNEEEVDRITDWLIEHKTDGLAKKGIADTWFREDDYRRFLKDVSRAAFRAGSLLIVWLALDGVPIAATNCFFEGDLMEARTISYDPRWAKFSPGIIVIDETIAGAFDLGIETIDFRMGTENYKSNWNSEWSSVFRYRIPLSRPGVLFLKLREARLTWRYLFKRTASSVSSLIYAGRND